MTPAALYATYDDLLRRCRAALQESAWKPIETAPRNQSSFLMAYHYKDGPTFVTIARSPPSHATRYAWWNTESGCVPVVETHPVDTKHRCLAVGWMPIPETPLSARAAEIEGLLGEIAAVLGALQRNPSAGGFRHVTE